MSGKCRIQLQVKENENEEREPKGNNPLCDDKVEGES